MAEPLIISASGIRGIVGAGLSPDVASRFGAAFATYLATVGARAEGDHVVVGRDSRTSGALLVDAAAAGIRSVGFEVRDLGIVPTPTGLLAVADEPRAAGGLLVTASHNPIEWNGLKLAGREGRFLIPEAGEKVRRLFDGEPAYREWDSLGGRSETVGAIEHHLNRILELSLLAPERVRSRRFTVVMDCVRGAGGLIMPRLLERLGCRVIGLNLEADGRFPRNPEPTAANLGELEAAVRETDADLGLAVDPDVDRLAIVDETGRAIGEDWTLALAVEQLLSREPGSVVTNLSTSACVRDAAVRAGQPFHLAPVGEANVVARMEEVGAVVGGEGNGGVILPRLHTTRDAPLAAALLLQLLADREMRIGELIAQWPRYYIAKGRVRRSDAALQQLYARIEEAADDASAERRDGLRLDWPDGRWLHIRPSGTEPILRIIAEAGSQSDAAQLVEWGRGFVGHEG